MNTRKVLAGVAGLAAAASLLCNAAPASALPGDTEVTFTLVSGTLSIQVSGDQTVDLGNKTPDGVLAQFTGNLLATTVTDNRNSLAGYTVSANCDDFEDGGTNVIEKTNVTVAIPSVTAASVGGDALLDPTDLFVATPGGTACGASAGDIGTQLGGSALTNVIAGLTGVTSSNHVVTYTPQITVTVPPGTAPATYSSVVYQTVL